MPWWIPPLACFVTCMQQNPQIQLWCNTCWPLGGQYGSQVVLIYVLAYFHFVFETYLGVHSALICRIHNIVWMLHLCSSWRDTGKHIQDTNWQYHPMGNLKYLYRNILNLLFFFWKALQQNLEHLVISSIQCILNLNNNLCHQQF